ncbi:MAG: peptidylprolyl isomerase [Nitrospirae bacterium]|nr:peptidylprolyl isomerase [Nitrospirota bacterium]MBF0535834.1 peptidylprolyl isomerase [Nitrospirota bacterium]MBF0617701.1 peptidylprolyl isomerase [Nitrospirota bacterium]
MFAGKEGITKLVDELKKRETLYLEAKKAGLDKDPVYIKKVDDFKKGYLINSLISRNVGTEGIKVTPEEAKEYFDKNPKDFEVTEQRKASHILVKTEDEAKDVLAKIKKGEDFGKLAKETSIDKMSAEKNGDVGYFGKGQMVPEFDKAVFSMSKGEISAPVKSQFGYHIIKLTDIQPTKKLEFENSKAMIMQFLTQEKQKKAFEAYMSQVEKGYTITVDQKVLDDFVNKHMGVKPEVGAGALPPDHGAPPPQPAPDKK